MKTYLVLTAMGPDRPGLVDKLTELLYARGANVEDSRMAILGGEFGLLLLVSCEAGEAERLRAELPALERSAGVQATLKPTREPARGPAAGVPYDVTAVSLDHPGIVHAVTGALAGHGANIESLDTRLSPAAESGTTVFHLHARVRLPATARLHAVRASLDCVAEQWNMDFTMEACE